MDNGGKGRDIENILKNRHIKSYAGSRTLSGAPKGKGENFELGLNGLRGRLECWHMTSDFVGETQ